MSDTNSTHINLSVDDSLRDRLIAVLYDGGDMPASKAARLADAVIEELDTVFMDFGLWLAEEIRGRPMPRQDMESCLSDWMAEDV